jgi:hypothetical protein
MDAETPHMDAKNPAPRAPEPSVTIKEPSDSIRRDPVADELERWASRQSVASFIAYRKKSKGKALTETAAKRLGNTLQEILRAGGDPDDALGMAEERGWLTVKPDWYFRERNGRGNGNSASGGIPDSGRRNDPAIDNILRLTGLG